MAALPRHMGGVGCGTELARGEQSKGQPAIGCEEVGKIKEASTSSASMVAMPLLNIVLHY